MKNLTVKQIKQQLDELGIEYASNLRKEELLDLLNEFKFKTKRYIVIHDFKDLQDKGYVYLKGDKYPREGKQVSEERIQELMSDKNKIGNPLIKEQD